jgi:pSer/pThr/pTyr-binding forkhead associated (FHA) protein
MKCTQCQMENIEGALFCEECGAKLDGLENIESATNEAEGSQLILATSDGNRLDLPEKDEVVIGREDPISEVFPDVDLTSLGGMEKGVSRKHAVIHRSGDGFSVEDMGSTNGTYVNKKRISPHVPEVIKAGDEVRFGKLSLAVRAA